MTGLVSGLALAVAGQATPDSLIDLWDQLGYVGDDPDRVAVLLQRALQERMQQHLGCSPGEEEWEYSSDGSPTLSYRLCQSSAHNYAYWVGDVGCDFVVGLIAAMEAPVKQVDEPDNVVPFQRPSESEW